MKIYETSMYADYVLQPSGQQIHYTYGLHKRCSSLTKNCSPFPQQVDCHNDRYFCSMWRSVGFLMSFAVVMEGMTLIAYIVMMLGGKQKREQGWRILSGFHVIIAILLGAGMSIIVCDGTFAIGKRWVLLTGPGQAYLYDHDDRFFPGWKLDISWILCTASFSAVLGLFVGLPLAMLLLPVEGGYELIPNPSDEYD